MQIIPAVDIKSGKCVRLTQGRPETEIVYEEDPLKAALHWQEEGAGYLHIVDLDGAFSGETVNFSVIKNILARLKIPAEVGGGIRTLDSIKKYLDLGADRVVLGTKAATSEIFLEESIDKFGKRIAIAIDASGGRIVIEGWAKEIDATPVELAKKAKGVTIIYTDTTVDGTLKGPNFKGIEEFANAIKTNLIVSGGISSLSDIKKLKEIKGVTGVIIGKALYAGRIRLSDVI